MVELKRSKKGRIKNALFNPYKNGISSYDLAFLSSKKTRKDKTNRSNNKLIEDYYAA